MGINRVEEKGENWSVEVPLAGDEEIMAYDVPSRVRLKYRKVGNYLGTVAAWGTAYWEVLLNGTLVERIFDQIGYAAQRELVSKIYAFPGDRVSVVGYNPAGWPAAAALEMGVGLTWDVEYLD